MAAALSVVAAVVTLGSGPTGRPLLSTQATGPSHGPGLQRRAAHGPAPPGGRRSRRHRRRGLHRRVQPGRRGHAARRRLRPGSGCHGRQRGRSRRAAALPPLSLTVVNPAPTTTTTTTTRRPRRRPRRRPARRRPRRRTTDHHDDHSEHARRGWDARATARATGRATDKATDKATDRATDKATDRATGRATGGQRPRGRTGRPQPRRQPGPWVRRELAAARSRRTAHRTPGTASTAAPEHHPDAAQPGAAGAPETAAAGKYAGAGHDRGRLRARSAMNYTNLGASGLRVSRVCLGMMGFGNDSDRAWVIDEDAAEPIVRAAVRAASPSSTRRTPTRAAPARWRRGGWCRSS